MPACNTTSSRWSVTGTCRWLEVVRDVTHRLHVAQILTLENYQSNMFDTIRATNYGSAAFFVAWIVVGKYILLTLFLAVTLEAFEAKYDTQVRTACSCYSAHAQVPVQSGPLPDLLHVTKKLLGHPVRKRPAQTHLVVDAGCSFNQFTVCPVPRGVLDTSRAPAPHAIAVWSRVWSS